MHPFSAALPLSNVQARVTRGALVAHRHSFAPPRCMTSQYRRSFVPLSVSLWDDISDPVFDGVGLAGFKSRADAFLLAWICSFFFISYFFYLFHPSMCWLCGVGVFGLIECSHSLPALHSGLQLIINNTNNNNNNNRNCASLSKSECTSINEFVRNIKCCAAYTHKRNHGFDIFKTRTGQQ